MPTPIAIVDPDAAQQLVDMVDAAMDRAWSAQRDATSSKTSDEIYGMIPLLRNVRRALTEALDMKEENNGK